MTLLNQQALRESGCVLALDLKNARQAIYAPNSGYLSVAGCLNFGTGDFTVEFFAKVSENGDYIFDANPSSGRFNVAIYSTGINTLIANAANHIATVTNSVDGTTWNHYVFERASGVAKAFKDGVLIDNWAFTQSITDATLFIMSQYSQASYNTGYLREFRISNIARYAGTVNGTTYFNPLTLSFPDDSNTVLLLHGDTLTDDARSGRSAKTITNSGTIVVKNDMTPDSTRYSDVNISGSYVAHTPHDATINGDCALHVGKDGQGLMYFDGTGDYCTFAADTEITMGSGNFTIAMWANMGTVNAIHTLLHLFAATNSGIEIYTNASAKLCVKCSDTSTAGNMVNTTGSASVSASTWYHIALVRSGPSFTVYLNCVSDSTGSSAATIITPTACCLGARYNAGTPDQLQVGYIRGTTILKGKALDIVQLRNLMEESRPDYIV